MLSYLPSYSRPDYNVTWILQEIEQSLDTSAPILFPLVSESCSVSSLKDHWCLHKAKSCQTLWNLRLSTNMSDVWRNSLVKPLNFLSYFPLWSIRSITSCLRRMRYVILVSENISNSERRQLLPWQRMVVATHKNPTTRFLLHDCNCQRCCILFSNTLQNFIRDLCDMSEFMVLVSKMKKKNIPHSVWDLGYDQDEHRLSPYSTSKYVHLLSLCIKKVQEKHNALDTRKSLSSLSDSAFNISKPKGYVKPC